MKKLINLLFKQYTVVPSWVGGLIIVQIETLGMVGLFTFAGVMNQTWIAHPQWHIYFFNNFPFFLFCFVPPFELTALLHYKFMVFARQKYQQYQSFSPERNPLVQEVKKQGEKLDAIAKAVGVDLSKIK